MRTSKLILDKAREVTAAHKVLEPYVKSEEYFAYLSGLHAAINILQTHEEQEFFDTQNRDTARVDAPQEES